MAVFLAAMVFAAAGCGGGSAEETTAEKNTVEATTEAAPQPSYKAGTWEGDVYTNETLGMKFTVPEGWERGSEEEAEKIFAAELPDWKKSLWGYSAELYVTNADKVTSMGILSFDDTGEEEEDILDSFRNGLTESLDELKEMGFEITENEVEDRVYGNTSFRVKEVKSEYLSAAMYFTCAVTVKEGKMILIMEVDYTDDTYTERIIDAIQPLN